MDSQIHGNTENDGYGDGIHQDEKGSKKKMPTAIQEGETDKESIIFPSNPRKWKILVKLKIGPVSNICPSFFRVRVVNLNQLCNGEMHILYQKLLLPRTFIFTFLQN